MKKTISIIYCFLCLYPLALRAQDAPVTTAARITDASTGDTVTAPITVTGFNDIGEFTLTMRFDTTRIQYVSANTNPSLTGMSVNFTPPSGGTVGRLILSWSNVSNLILADNSSLADLAFHYKTGTGILTWYYSSPFVCEYKSWVSGSLTLLNDSPESDFYLNGGISNRSAPFTYAPSFPNPVPGDLQIPIIVYDFTNIGAITLYLDYDPSVITYQSSYTKNAAFGSGFYVIDIDGVGGHRYIVVGWSDVNGVTLNDGDTLCSFDFNYPSSSCYPCPLAWYDSGSTCEYSDAQGNPLIDMPQSDYYFDGLVSEAIIPTWAGSVDSTWDNAGNWNSCGVPDSLQNVIIPDVSPNPFPVISTTEYCKTIKVDTNATVTITSSGQLIVKDP